TIAISAKIVGALMITSLMVIPVATALLVSDSYKKTYLLSLIFSVIFMTAGITLSFYYGLKPGGAIVMIAIATLLIVAIIKIISTRVSTKISNEEVFFYGRFHLYNFLYKVVAIIYLRGDDMNLEQKVIKLSRSKYGENFF